MTKVIHVVTDMKIGGAGRWLINFLESADKKALHIQVVVPTGSILGDEVKKLGFEVIEVSGMQNRSFDWSSVHALYAVFRRERPHIVHTHASLSARIAARFVGSKVIHTRHCMDDGHRDRMRRWIFSTVDQVLSDHIIAVSGAVKARLIELGIQGHKISVIYNGVKAATPLKDFEKEAIKRQWGIEEKDITIGIVARLEEVKGHPLFLRAAKLVADEFPNVKFFIVGSGSKEQELKNLAQELQIEKRVIFTGFLHEVEKMMDVIDIHVISSRAEALCLALIEAMSLGKPCISTKTGGTPEVVQDRETGFLVPVGGENEMADAMKRLVESKDLRTQMGSKGKNYMLNHFTVDKMTEQIAAVYEAVQVKRRRIDGKTK